MLFSSHDLHHVQQVCDRVGLFVSGRLLAEGDIPSLSKKLFSRSPFVIEVGISSDSIEKYSATWLKGVLQSTEGVNSVKLKNRIFQIDCSRNATSDIARILVGLGENLNHLTVKEYGLDDIYYRYFEGGMNDEQ